MTPLSHRLLKTLAGAAALAATSASFDASAMSYLMMRDDALLAQSPLVVSGEILAVLPPVKNAGGFIAETQYAVRVDWVAKGKVDASTITLRLPGSIVEDQPGLRLDGVPQYVAGDRVLVFAEATKDGAYQPMQLALGLFREFEYAGDVFYQRDLDEADAMDKSFNAEFSKPRRAASFLSWIDATNRGMKSSVQYLETLPQDAVAKFTQMRDSGGTPVRWTTFQNGGTVNWHNTSAGQAGMVADEGTMTTNALAAWNNDTGSKISMAYAGTVASDAVSTTDGRNVISWSDPQNQISGSFSCGSGGTLAIGGPFWSSATNTANGVTYRTIIEGFVAMQDGAQCVFDGAGGANGAETLAHEIGHAIGFGHACGDSKSPACSTSATLNDALMRASIHGDGRGARLGADDRSAAATAYPDTTGGGGTLPAVIFVAGFE